MYLVSNVSLLFFTFVENQFEIDYGDPINFFLPLSKTEENRTKNLPVPLHQITFSFFFPNFIWSWSLFYFILFFFNNFFYLLKIQSSVVTPVVPVSIHKNLYFSSHIVRYPRWCGRIGNSSFSNASDFFLLVVKNDFIIFAWGIGFASHGWRWVFFCTCYRRLSTVSHGFEYLRWKDVQCFSHVLLHLFILFHLFLLLLWFY